jgi:hypothetical protein
MKSVVIKGVFPSLLAFVISACGVTPQEYESETPLMDMKTYFNGPVQAWGLFQDYRDKVTKRFHVSMQGEWQGNKGTLDEHFTYADGTTQRRVWHLVRIDKNTYSGTADDVVGEAQGVAFGHALRWQYTMALEVDDDIYNVKFDDWMYLIDDNTVINRSVMSKYGVTLGEVILVFIKANADGTPTNNSGPFNMPEVGNVKRVTSAIL